MFEELFTRRGTIASYRAAPLLDERLRYLRHCSQAGVGRATLRQIAAHQLHLVQVPDPFTSGLLPCGHLVRMKLVPRGCGKPAP